MAACEKEGLPHAPCVLRESPQSALTNPAEVSGLRFGSLWLGFV